MKNICFYFQVHQPYRISDYSAFDIGSSKEYFHGPERATNYEMFKKVAQKCYLPTNNLFLKLLADHPELKISYSITGVFLDQCLEFGEVGAQVLDSFKALANTGQVEFLAETYYHSLAALYSQEEFVAQVKKHKSTIKKLFGKKPKVFRNTELIYNNDIAQIVHDMGFHGILLEGWDHCLKDRTPNLVYRPPINSRRKKNRFGLLLKNYKLSDDIAFRFSNKDWSHHPMTVNKFVDWTHQNYGDTINLFMDYETFGEHQWEDTGIFDFLRHLPGICLDNELKFHTPSEALANTQHEEILDVPHYLSWADMERDLSAWLGNEMQEASMRRVFALEDQINRVGDTKLLDTWRKLQTSDHFYYMSTKYWSDGDVHKYFSPFESPYDAFINYMNILNDFEHKINSVLHAQPA